MCKHCLGASLLDLEHLKEPLLILRNETKGVATLIYNIQKNIIV